MKRYHFHASDGSAFPDEDGEQLAGIDDAKAMALEVLREMLALKSAEFFKDKKFSVNVKDETGRMVMTLTTVMTIDHASDPTVPPEA